ncbi:hypothetical protein AGMMS50256_00850 [Betaproteobacteria bacterium]|nr:hypothetical protein AGMMS50256_00850 [Betaproteobacteria bacterium]
MFCTNNINMTPEAQARQHIDQKLEQAGWAVQDRKAVNLSAALGVAVREYHTNTGPADYVLFVDRKLVGVIEAKKTPQAKTLLSLRARANVTSCQA